MAKVLKALRDWFDEAFDAETYYKTQEVM